MWKPITFLALTLAAGGIAPARAEITSQGSPGGEAVTEGRMSAECWQGGQKIMSETDLEAANVGGYLREKSLTFKRVGARSGAGVIVVPFEHSVCILRTMR